MFMRSTFSVALLVSALMLSPSGPAKAAGDDGIVRIKSAYSMPETIKRLKKDVADKGIMFFNEIDQSKLATDAGVTLRPSTLLRVWQSATRNAVPDLQSGRRTRLAC